jgi:hypothetical protein
MTKYVVDLGTRIIKVVDTAGSTTEIKDASELYAIANAIKALAYEQEEKERRGQWACLTRSE